MKNFFKSLAICALAALTFASCQKENAGGNMDDQSSVVSINLTSPLMGTKAFADGTTVDVVHVHVYKVGANGELTYIAPGTGSTVTPSQDVRMSSGTATYSTRLVTGQTYTFVFWAEKSGNGHYTYTPANQTIAVNYASATGNDETRDAFYAVLPNVQITGAYSNSVELKRPFAQVNFGVTAEDMAAANAAGITVNKAAVECTNVANQLNLLDGTVSGSEDVAFASAALPSETLSAANKTYKYVAMNYVLVGKNASTLSDITLTLEATGAESATPEYTYTNIPLQGNYRTNIVGDLFTSPASINITVDSNFEGDNNEVIQNVSSIAAANTAFANGATNVSISVAENGDPETIVLPNTIKSVTLTIESYPATRDLTIDYSSGTGAAKPASLIVTAPNAQNITINCPETHVEVNGVTATSITASTSNNTLVVGSDVKVTTLTINAGSAIIYGNVTTLVKGENAGEIEWHVTTSGSLTKALKVADKIVLEKAIKPIILSQSFTIERDVTIDMNGFSLTATYYPLKITKGNVNIIGSGQLKGQFSMLLMGSTEDVSDYCVVNLGPDVELNASSCGIIINPPASTGYNNYGIVVNSKAQIISDAESSIGITINGSNKITGVNVPKFNINGGTIKATVGIYAAGYAEWSLNNCEVEGDLTAIEIRAGKMTIDGGTYTSYKDPFDVEPNGSGTTTEGAALGISQHTTDLPIEVVVNGGTFNGAYAIWEKDVQNETARDKIKLTVNDGIFNGAIYSQNNKNCLIGGTYDDVSALDYMGNYNGDINISMARDGSINTSNFYLNRGGANTHTITINGNSHKLTFHSTYRNHIQTSNGAKIILKNATVDSDYQVGGSTWDDYGLIFQCPTEFENVTFNRQLALEQPYAHKLTNVTINQTSATGDMYALWIEAGADVTFNGGTVNSINPNSGSLNRAIKIADEYITDPQLTKLNVSGVTFKSQKKAAVLVTSAAGADIIWGEGNDISGVAADQTNAVWNDADRTAAWDLVTVTGCTKFQEQE